MDGKRKLKNLVFKIGVSLVAATFLFSCTRNVDFVKKHAKNRWTELGFYVGGYEGYQPSLLCGGDVWYQLKRDDSPGVVYEAYLCKWGDELHVVDTKIMSGNQFQLNEWK